MRGRRLKNQVVEVLSEYPFSKKVFHLLCSCSSYSWTLFVSMGQIDRDREGDCDGRGMGMVLAALTCEMRIAGLNKTVIHVVRVAKLTTCNLLSI